MDNFKKIIDKIKKDKKSIIIFACGILIIVLIMISEIDIEKEKEIVDDEVSDTEYCSYLESKIKDFVETIDGAGKTEVIITLAETTEYIYATDDKDTRKNSSSNNDYTLQKDYVIIDNNNNDEGLLIKTIEPKARGVAISCEGADNIKVQEQIYSTVEALLDLNTSDISISKLSLSEEKYEK